MKYPILFVPVAVLMLSGFTWGESKESSYPASNKKTVSSGMSASAYSSTSTGAASTPAQRAAAFRTLASGDEATRKARLDSLQRIGAAMNKKRQQETQSQY